MAQPRDIFTMSAFGREPTLADLLIALPGPVSKALVGVAVSTIAEAAAATAGRDGVELQDVWETAQLVLQGGRLDSDELESIARQNGFKPTARETAHGIAFRLVRLLGVTKARELLEAALAPEALDNSGTFSHFRAPRLPADLDAIEISARIEAGLEMALSTPKSKRLVKVRAEFVGVRLLVGVYYQRRDTDGRRITSDKKLATHSFARAAGSTYFAVTKHEKSSRVMFRSPASPIVERLRPLIGDAIWGKAYAIETKAHSEYNLAIFKDPDFQLDVATDFRPTINRVHLAEIDVKAATGNSVRVKAPGANGDALSDFHAISKKNQVLIRNSAVQSVTVKFALQHDKRRRPRVRITPTTLTLDEQHLATVEAHLLHWGVVGD